MFKWWDASAVEKTNKNNWKWSIISLLTEWCVFFLLKVCINLKINFAKGAYYNMKNQFVQQSAMNIKMKFQQKISDWYNDILS
jgi:hypothetical protein